MNRPQNEQMKQRAWCFWIKYFVWILANGSSKQLDMWIPHNMTCTCCMAREYSIWRYSKCLLSSGLFLPEWRGHKLIIEHALFKIRRSALRDDYTTKHSERKGAGFLGFGSISLVPPSVFWVWQGPRADLMSIDAFLPWASNLDLFSFFGEAWFLIDESRCRGPNGAIFPSTPAHTGAHINKIFACSHVWSKTNTPYS